MSNRTIKILSAEETAMTVNMKDAIQAMGDAFRQLSDKSAIAPLRIPLSLPEEQGDALFMPVYLPSTKKFGLKTVSLFYENKRRGLPLIQALIAIYDATDGSPLAIMDGENLTALRTGAASGLATQLLARENSTRVAIIGAGVQGRTQLNAVSEIRNLEKVYVIDCEIEAARNFLGEIGIIKNCEFEATTDASAVSDADIICCATTSNAPVFKDSDIQPGTHINGIGSFKENMQEIPGETICRSKLVVDSRKACLAEAGDLLIPLKKGLISEKHIYAEIGEIAGGQHQGRTNRNEITVFKSVGNAVQDLAVADIVLREAERQNLGTLFKI